MSRTASGGSRKNEGIGLLGMLGVAFVVLKLTGVIAWSWWWVTAPFWGGIALTALIMIACFTVIGLDAYLKERKARRPGRGD